MSINNVWEQINGEVVLLPLDDLQADELLLSLGLDSLSDVS